MWMPLQRRRLCSERRDQLHKDRAPMRVGTPKVCAHAHGHIEGLCKYMSYSFEFLSFQSGLLFRVRTSFAQDRALVLPLQQVMRSSRPGTSDGILNVAEEDCRPLAALAKMPLGRTAGVRPRVPSR